MNRCPPRFDGWVLAIAGETLKQGARQVAIQLVSAEHAAAAALAIYIAEATAYHDDTLDDRADQYSEQVRTFLELGDQLLAKDYLHAQRFRTLLGKDLASLFGDVDVIATPTTPVTATPLGDTEVGINGEPDSVFGALLRNTEPFNLVGLPAVVGPCGFDNNGMPVSVQIVGPAFAEARVLRVMHTYQKLTDWHRQRPAVT